MGAGDGFFGYDPGFTMRAEKVFVDDTLFSGILDGLDPKTTQEALNIIDEYLIGVVPYVDGNSDMYFKKNGYTLELWFKDNLVHSWTVDATPLTADDGITELTADDGTTPLTGD